MRSHGCDACGLTIETKTRPDGWAAIRFVRYGHKPSTYELCPGCGTDLEHLLTSTARGQTRIHRDPTLPANHVEGTQ